SRSSDRHGKSFSHQSKVAYSSSNPPHTDHPRQPSFLASTSGAEAPWHRRALLNRSAELGSGRSCTAGDHRSQRYSSNYNVAIYDRPPPETFARTSSGVPIGWALLRWLATNVARNVMVKHIRPVPERRGPCRSFARGRQRLRCAEGL